jgi:hypothetical protein
MTQLRQTWETTVCAVGIDVMTANEAKGCDARITSRDNIPTQDDDSVGESIATALTGYLSSFTLPEDDNDNLSAPPNHYQGNMSYVDAAKTVTDTIKTGTSESDGNIKRKVSEYPTFGRGGSGGGGYGTSQPGRGGRGRTKQQSKESNEIEDIR